MDAREYLEKKFIVKDHRISCEIPGVSFDYYWLTDLLESYHAERSKEEAEERYKKAVNHYKENGRMNLGQFNMLALDNTLRIASGKEEG